VQKVIEFIAANIDTVDTFFSSRFDSVEVTAISADRVYVNVTVSDDDKKAFGEKMKKLSVFKKAYVETTDVNFSVSDIYDENFVVPKGAFDYKTKYQIYEV
jgi:hypothetical protein